MSILCDPQRLRKAAEILIRANEDGCELDLSDWIQSGMREFRRDSTRRWRLESPIGAINRLATELSRLTGAEFEPCKAAICAATGDCEVTAAIDAMLEFGQQRWPARRRIA